MMNMHKSVISFRNLLLITLASFTFGLFVPGLSLARVEFHNGYEGDPLDGDDISAGGGGNPISDAPYHQPQERVPLIFQLNEIFGINGQFAVLVPIFENGKIHWNIVIYNSNGGEE